MAPRPHQRRSSRIVQLPTGKTVEVHYFSSDGPAVRRPSGAPAPAPAVDLVRCPACASDVVYPTAWHEAGNRAFELTLRCPNCEWTDVETHDWDTVQRFEDRLDRGERALVADLRAIARANVQEDFDRFIAALNAGHVWPMDF
jgi:hypothetical protein